MYFCGIDIGSATGKIVILGKDGAIIFHNITPTIGTAIATYEKLLGNIPSGIRDRIASTLATGYGRAALEDKLHHTATEISCHFEGVKKTNPAVKAIIDIGGQDSKVITIDNSIIKDFMMNDKCAAGTGRFLEVMVQRLGYTIEDFCELDITGIPTVNLSSTCTVFAESEVVSLMSSGTKPLTVASSIALMAANNIYFMTKRLFATAPFFMTGGVSRVKPVVQHLSFLLKSNIETCDFSQQMGAYGAAILAKKRYEEING